jgi:hypothetical protein
MKIRNLLPPYKSQFNKKELFSDPKHCNSVYQYQMLRKLERDQFDLNKRLKKAPDYAIIGIKEQLEKVNSDIKESVEEYKENKQKMEAMTPEKLWAIQRDKGMARLHAVMEEQDRQRGENRVTKWMRDHLTFLYP